MVKLIPVACFLNMSYEKEVMKKAYLSVLAALVSAITFAQEKSAELDVNINTDEGNSWYASPLVWVIGAAVFILLLVALLRGGRRAD